MARLPDFTALGVRDPNSVRGVPTFDGKDYEAAALGKMGEALTEAGSVGYRYLKQEQEKDAGLQSVQANATYQTGRIKLANAMADETDPEKIKTYPEQHQALLDQAAAAISDPDKRQRFILSNSPDIEVQRGSATKQAFGIQRDAALADTFTRLTDLQQTAATAKTDDDRAKAITAGQDLIQKLRDGDFITEEDSAKRQRAFANGYAVAAFQRLSPTERLEALSPVNLSDRSKQAFEYFKSQGWTPAQAAGIAGNLIHESGLNTGARNPGDGSDGSDSIGLAQWNSGRAEALRAFASARGKPVSDYRTQLEFVNHELSTTEGAAAEKLRGATTPRDAAAAFTHFERPKGYEGGAEATHGWRNRLRQAEGVFSAYGGGGPLAPAVGEQLKKFLNPDQMESLRNGAEREYTFDQRQSLAAVRAESASTNALIKDDEASIASTGKPVAELTTDRVAKVLGPDKAAAFAANRVQAQRFYDQTNDLDAIPAGEIRSRITAMEPQPGKAGYAEASSWYGAASKKANEVLKLRASDPAAAVDKLPDVQAAAQGASLDKPATFAPLVKARLTAMERVGIPEDNRIPVTRAEALALWKPIELAVKGGDAGEIRDMLKATAQDAQAAFGEHADDVMAAVLREGKASRETSETAAAVLRKLAKGEAPTRVETKAVDSAQKNDAARSAVVGVNQPTDLNEAGTDGMSGKPAAPAEKSFPTPDAGAIGMLRKSPALAPQYDAIYGPGSAAKVLKVTR